MATGIPLSKSTRMNYHIDIKGYEPNLEPDYHEAIIDEKHGPSVMYLQGYVKGRGEYTGASYINYCPMCGRKLNKD